MRADEEFASLRAAVQGYHRDIDNLLAELKHKNNLLRDCETALDDARQRINRLEAEAIRAKGVAP